MVIYWMILGLSILYRGSRASPDKVGALRCDVGWKYFGCFCYRFFKAEVDWESAKNGCRDYNAELVSIQSEIENDFVNDLMPNQAECWIGLYDINSEGDWEWVDDRKVTWINWSKNQPNSKDREQDCAEFWSIESTWNDESCMVKNPYICKKVAEIEISLGGIQVIPSATDAALVLNTGAECVSHLNAVDWIYGKRWVKISKKGESTHMFDITPLKPCTNYSIPMKAEYKMDRSRTTKLFTLSFRTSIDKFPNVPAFDVTIRNQIAVVSWNNTFRNHQCISQYELNLQEMEPLLPLCEPNEGCQGGKMKQKRVLSSEEFLPISVKNCRIYSIDLGYITIFEDNIHSGRATFLKTPCEASSDIVPKLKVTSAALVHWPTMKDPARYEYVLQYQRLDPEDMGPRETRYLSPDATNYRAENLTECSMYAFNLGYVTKGGNATFSEESETFNTTCPELPPPPSKAANVEHLCRWLFLVCTILVTLSSRQFPS